MGAKLIYLHEALHRGLREPNHPDRFYRRVTTEVWRFYQSYPEYIPERWDGLYF